MAGLAQSRRACADISTKNNNMVCTTVSLVHDVLQKQVTRPNTISPLHAPLSSETSIPQSLRSSIMTLSIIAVPSGGKCGAPTGGTCASGLCCSKSGGYCGSTAEFCDACQLAYSSSASCIDAGEPLYLAGGAVVLRLSCWQSSIRIAEPVLPDVN